MITFPSTIAADDFTGPCVLNVQSEESELGSVPSAMPHNAGEPRNIGQSVLADARTGTDWAGRSASRPQPDAAITASASSQYAILICYFPAQVLLPCASAHPTEPDSLGLIYHG